MIYDNVFLQELVGYQHKNVYVKLIAIDYFDHPIETIEGVVTGGNINISGESAIQRTCSLSLIVPEGSHISETSWAFKTKFIVEIGLKNDINPKYDSIIWFKQGTFIVKSFSKNIQANGGIAVSISGMDKMCRLNGSIGGTLPADVNFGELDTIVDDNGTIVTTKVRIYDIITSALEQFGDERLDNIIINDLPSNGLELWTYRGDTPLYLVVSKDIDTQAFTGIVNMTIDENAKISNTKITEVKKYYSTNTLDPEYNNDASTYQYHTNEEFNVAIAKIEYGETAGYAGRQRRRAGCVAQLGSP